MNLFAVVTEEQRIQKAVVGIMYEEKYMPLAGVLMMANRTVRDDPELTAYTDGRD